MELHRKIILGAGSFGYVCAATSHLEESKHRDLVAKVPHQNKSVVTEQRILAEIGSHSAIVDLVFWPNDLSYLVFGKC